MLHVVLKHGAEADGVITKPLKRLSFLVPVLRLGYGEHWITKRRSYQYLRGGKRL